MSYSATPRPFGALHRASTRYEIGLYQNGALVDVLAYDAKRTRRALFAAMCQHGKRIIAMLPPAEQGGDSPIPWNSKAQRWEVSPSLYVGWTGHTEYERASCLAAAA